MFELRLRAFDALGKLKRSCTRPIYAVRTLTLWPLLAEVHMSMGSHGTWTCASATVATLLLLLGMLGIAGGAAGAALTAFISDSGKMGSSEQRWQPLGQGAVPDQPGPEGPS